MRWNVPSRCTTVAIVLEGQGWRRTQGSSKEGLERTNIQQTSRTLAMQWHRSINCMMHYVHSLIVTQYIGMNVVFCVPSPVLPPSLITTVIKYICVVGGALAGTTILHAW